MWIRRDGAAAEAGFKPGQAPGPIGKPNKDMKTVLRKTLSSRVNNGWFVLSCVLLGTVLLGATLMTWDLNSYTDKALKDESRLELGYFRK